MKDKPFELRVRHRPRGGWTEGNFSSRKDRDEAAQVLTLADKGTLGGRVEIRDSIDEPWRLW